MICGAEFFEDVLGNGLHAGDSADRHEDGGLDIAMRRLDAPDTGAAIASLNSEGEGHREIVIREATFITATREGWGERSFVRGH